MVSQDNNSSDKSDVVPLSCSIVLGCIFSLLMYRSVVMLALQWPVVLVGHRAVVL